MKLLTAFAPLLLLLGNVSPMATEAVRMAGLNSVLPDSCPLYTDIDDDLEDMGVPRILYPETDIGDVQMVTMVEWGYTGAIEAPEGFGLYVYLYDPQARNWTASGNVTIACADEGDGFYDNTFRSFRMSLLDTSDDGVFTKWSVNDADYAYTLVDSTERDYLIGQVTLDEASGKGTSFAIGTEYSFLGFPKVGNNDSTLAMRKSPFRSVRAEVYPFTSDFGGIDGAYALAYGLTVDVPLNSEIDAYSVVFSLPSWVSDFGELESVHYEYWKYRTTWIIGYNTQTDYEQALLFRGVDGLGSDGNYVSGKTPSFGYSWSAPFDYDDLADVDPTATYDTHVGFSRFYNNNVDSGHHELRVDNPSWTMWLGECGDEYGYTSDEILSYAESYDLDKDSSDDLPVLNGKVSNELFYIPSYSDDGLFKKYGHIDNSISRSDILSLNFDAMAKSRFNEYIPLVGGGNTEDLFLLKDNAGEWIDESVYSDATDLYGVYRAVMESQDDANASLLFGDESLPLLDDYTADDPVVERIDSEYSSGLDSFVSSQAGNLYRLTYDMGFSNSYRCLAGSSSMLDGTWTGRTVSASKTDVVFDFRFIDFTFRDGSATYTLPSASDPFDISGNPTVPDDGIADGLPRWAVILIVCLVLFLAVGILAIFFPFFKLILRGALYVVQVIIDILYLVFVWWWLAIVKKAQREELPPLWIFGK